MLWHHLRASVTLIDIDWLLLALAAVSCAPLLGSLDGCWWPQGDCPVLCSHKRQTQYTHKEDNRDPCRRFYCIFRVMILERRATHRCVNLCVLLVLSVSMCWRVFIGVWTFCTRIKWITPIHFIVSPFTSHPFLFPFHIILLFSEKVRTEKRQMKGVLLRFYSNSDLNYR